MDGPRFDQLARELLDGASRRRLLRLFGAVPVLGGLASVVAQTEARKGNGKHDNDKNDDDVAGEKNRGKRRKKQCQTKKAQACDGKCGTVTVKCKKANGKAKKTQIDCGSCSCQPACGECLICNAATTTCVADPQQVGDPCGQGGQVCQADGTCTGPACNVCANDCAFETVQAAIDAADPGDTITVCEGTYNEALFIDKDLSIVGAGQGADPNTSTIIDGTGTTRVVRVEGNDVLVTLQNLRITGGAGHCCGTGLDADADVTLIDVTVIGNTADESGGGLFNNPGRTMTLINSTVTDNVSNDIGGGIYNQGTLVLTNTDVIDNVAATEGGGIYNTLGTVSLTDSVVSGNDALDGEGGGIFDDGGELTLTNSQVSGNTATSLSGGIRNGGTLTLDGTSVTGNTAGAQGGGLYNQGTLTLINGATITGNTAAITGGGVFNQGTIACPGGTISGNEAPPGTPNQCVDDSGGTGCLACLA